MLPKIVGILLIIVACTGMGYSKSWEMKKQLEELETLKHIFILLKTELSYSHMTFGEIFSRIGEKIPGEFGKWLINLGGRLERKEKYCLADIWKETIAEKLKDTHLGEMDLIELQKLGSNLGYLESIDLYINKLEYEIKIRREEYRSKRKLCQSMGIMSGIFLVILLL